MSGPAQYASRGATRPAPLGPRPLDAGLEATGTPIESVSELPPERPEPLPAEGLHQGIAEVARPVSQAVILVCDHRGEGTLEKVAAAASGHAVEGTGQLRDTLERLAVLRPAVIVVDPLARVGSVELRAIERARAHAAEPPTPVLVVTDPGDPLIPILCARALEHGAWDLVHRSAPPEEIQMRMARLEHLSERLAEMEVLRHRAAHDDRTDLLRPQAFQERLREHVSAAQRHHFDLALLLLDLDHFGKVNKLHDHTVGDLVIARVGSVIRGALRTEDVAGRLGGDEFAVVLPYTKKVDAVRVLQRLLEGIHELSGRLPGAKADIQISASIGFETFNGTDLDGAQTLRLHAEEALRHAKARGGNQGVYFRGLEAARESGLADQE